MIYLIYGLAALAALQIAIVLVLVVLWQLSKLVARAQLRRLAKAAGPLTDQPPQA